MKICDRYERVPNQQTQILQVSQGLYASEYLFCQYLKDVNWYIHTFICILNIKEIFWILGQKQKIDQAVAYLW